MQQVDSYFDDLFQRRQTAIKLAVLNAVYLDGSAPRLAQCHDNVDRWLAENREGCAVRGWAIEADYGHSAMFAAHSVLSLDGVLTDITLDQPYRFLRHVGTDAEFEFLRVHHAQRIWPPSSARDGTSLPPHSADELIGAARHPFSDGCGF